VKVGYVAVIGRPNVGKSTLVNTLLKFKLAAVSPKPQTTRCKILGIINEEDAQILLLDTPGIFKKSMYALHDYMIKEAVESIRDADVVVWVVEPVMPTELEEDIAEKIKEATKEKKTPVILAINKIDTVHKNTLLPIMDAYSRLYDFSAYVPISALKNDGLDILLEEIKKHLPEGEPFYPTDQGKAVINNRVVSVGTKGDTMWVLTLKDIRYLYDGNLVYSVDFGDKRFLTGTVKKDTFYWITYDKAVRLSSIYRYRIVKAENTGG